MTSERTFSASTEEDDDDSPRSPQRSGACGRHEEEAPMTRENPYGCDSIGHDTYFEETQAGVCPACGLEITAVGPLDA